MSQSRLISKTVGSLDLISSSTLKLGNTTQVNIESRPAASALGATATTVTAAQLLTGILTQSPSSALTVTLPTAAAFIAALPDCEVGDSFKFTFINTNGTNAATIAVNVSTGTLVGSATVALSTSAGFIVRLTSVTDAGTYTVYRA